MTPHDWWRLADLSLITTQGYRSGLVRDRVVTKLKDSCGFPARLGGGGSLMMNTADKTVSSKVLFLPKRLDVFYPQTRQASLITHGYANNDLFHEPFHREGVVYPQARVFSSARVGCKSTVGGVMFSSWNFSQLSLCYAHSCRRRLSTNVLCSLS